MNTIKFLAGIIFCFLTGGALYLLFRMFVVFASFSGVSVEMTGLLSAILICYLISAIVWGRMIFDKWVIQYLKKTW